MDTPVLTSDVADVFWRPLTGRELEITQTRLDRAWSMLQDDVPGLVDRIQSGDLDVAKAEQVLIDAVSRVMNNPQGRRTESQTEDDYTHAWTIDSEVSTGALYFTERELDSLVRRGGLRGAFTIRPQGNPC